MVKNVLRKKFLISGFNDLKIEKTRPIIDQFHDIHKILLAWNNITNKQG